MKIFSVHSHKSNGSNSKYFVVTVLCVFEVTLLQQLPDVAAVHQWLTAVWPCPAGLEPESEGAAGVRGQRGGGHDDHLPDLPQRPVRKPAHVRPEGKRGQDPRHQRQQKGKGAGPGAIQNIDLPL